MRTITACITLGVLALSACSTPPSVVGAAKTCGGETAGIAVKDDMIEYDQSKDSTDDAWLCLLDELVADQADQYRITQGLDASMGAQDGTFDGLSAVWGVNPSRGIQLSFWPTIEG